MDLKIVSDRDESASGKNNVLPLEDVNAPDRLLNVGEVACLLGISRSSVYSWSKGGVLPSQKKLGRASRWSLRELNLWLQNRPRGAYGEEGGNMQ